ncbi:MAG TPA: VWA domain-containing protein [Acidobacteriaceae bacterium]|nr:VWA domain-containing protein [Acidobacteriaceae bacterium]
MRNTLILFFLLISGGAVLAQQAPAPPLPPEQQPPLNVDRDPVPAPGPSGAAAATSAPAAEQPGQVSRGKTGGYTLTKDVDEVVLSATVIDDHGHLITGLKADDFHVLEDGKPQNITSIQEQDIPVSIGLLIDNSGSMRTKRQAVNQAALDMVRASNPEDETFVVNFADEAYIDQDFTSDINRLRDGLSHIDSKGGTALYDAVIASADYMSKNAKRAKEVLLIITDGEDNASGTNLEETVRRIQDLQGPVVYSIGLLFDDSGGSGRESHRARRALQLLSDNTGGLAFFPKNLGQVDEIAAEVARDIRNQYTIGYHSSKPASLGGYRVVHVDAKAKGYGKMTVRTRPGYFPHSQPTATSKPATTSKK